MVMQCLNFLSDSNKVDSDEQIERSLTGINILATVCVPEVDLEYPKDLRELHSDYPLAPNKIELSREMLSQYQLKDADLYNIPTGNVKKLTPNVFDKEKYALHYKNLQLYLRLGLKLKKNTSSITI